MTEETQEAEAYIITHAEKQLIMGCLLGFNNLLYWGKRVIDWAEANTDISDYDGEQKATAEWVKDARSALTSHQDWLALTSEEVKMRPADKPAEEKRPQLPNLVMMAGTPEPPSG